MGPKNRPANEKKSYFCWSRKSWLFFLITLFMNMKNGTILLFSGSLSKICCTKLDLLQDIRKFYGALFDVHGFLKYERRHQSVAFNSLATQWVITYLMMWVCKEGNMYPTMHLFCLFSIPHCIRFVIIVLPFAINVVNVVFRRLKGRSQMTSLYMYMISLK